MFFKRINAFLSKGRVWITAFWIAAAVLLFLLAPSLSAVASSDEQIFLPKGTDSSLYYDAVKQYFPDAAKGKSMLLVVSDPAGLGDADKNYAVQLEKYLKDNTAKLNIDSITSPFTQEDLKDILISKDNQAGIMKVNFLPAADVTTKDIRTAIHSTRNAGVPAIPQGLTVNVTGDAAFMQEQVDNIQKSMETTMMITLILVVVVLLLVYRSPITPFISLASIGLAFSITRGLVALLTFTGFTVSSFTEIFLIAVMFGAGTDYCMLLISRYREELMKGLSSREALAAAYPRTATAIISSGGTVIVGSMGMTLAKFGLFNTTGPSIAIGMFISMLSVLTLPPALIYLFGERIFWPTHPSRTGEKVRKGVPFWTRMANSVTGHPLTYILIVAAILIPLVIFSTNYSRAFDSLSELPKGSDAVIGYDNLKAHFDQGEMLPVKVILKTDQDLWGNESLQAIDNAAIAMGKVDGVAKVRSATRPAGEQIEEVSLPSQIKTLSEGFTKATDAIDELYDGLQQMRDGLPDMKTQLKDGAAGLDKLANATTQAAGGIKDVSSGLAQLDVGQKSAIAGLNQVNTGLGSLSTGVTQSKAGVSSISSNLQSVKSRLEALLGSNPSLAGDPNFQTAYGTVNGVISSIPSITAGLNGVNGGIGQSQSGLSDAIDGLGQVDAGVLDAKGGADKIRPGLLTIASKQREAASGLRDAVDGITELDDALKKAQDGLTELKDGLKEAQDMAEAYATNGQKLNSVFYLPEGVLTDHPELKDAMQLYISPDGKAATFDVILSVFPYDAKALDSIAKIKDAAQFAVKGSILDNAEIHIGGSTSVMSELRQVTEEDFIRVMIFVLLGIFIVLIILLRSLTAPIYLIATILFSFFATLGISYLVFQVGMGKPGLSWSVPFFSFCLLVALGVDYNIFLISRIKDEYIPGQMKAGTSRALASTGQIITSCGIIMAGTFSGLLFSPVTQLVQIGFTTVVGLLLDTFIIRCMLVPAIAVKIGELNWWPGRRVRLMPSEKRGSARAWKKDEIDKN